MSKSIVKEFRKNGKIYYHFKCDTCENIQETYHKDYQNRKCIKCIGQSFVNNEYNGSIILEKIITDNKFQPISYKIKCKCEKIYQLRRDTLRNNINKGNIIQCTSCQRKLTALSNINSTKINQLNIFYKRYLKNANDRKYNFELSLEEFSEIISNNCYYCNDSGIKHGTRSTKYIVSNGIDRLNNDLGYTLENSVACCSICNKMKHAFTEKVFIEQINKIYKFKLETNKIIL